MSVIDANFLGDFESGSPEWHGLRDEPGVVTGTLAATVCGLNPWESAFTAWAKATGKISSERETTVKMRMGQLFEQPIKTLWAEQNPRFVVENTGTWSHKELEWARANPDAILTYPDGSKGILEIKTAGYRVESLPEHYRYQVLWYCFVLGLKKGKVVFEALHELIEFDVVFDEFEFSAILEAAKRWRACVLDDHKPYWDGSQSTFETVKALNGSVSDSEPVELGELGVHLSNAQAAFDKAQEHLLELKSRTLDALGACRSGVVSVGDESIVVATRSVNKNGVVSLSVKKGKNVG